MTWTTTKPTTPGYYWLRNYRIKNGWPTPHKIGLVLLTSVLDMPPTVNFHGNDGVCEVGDVEQGEWCGPIEPPK